jgi:hypothetical protein
MGLRAIEAQKLPSGFETNPASLQADVRLYLQCKANLPVVSRGNFPSLREHLRFSYPKLRNTTTRDAM